MWRLSKGSAMWRDVGKSVEGSIRAEIGGVENVRWNRVSPDIYPSSREQCPNTAKGEKEQNGMELKTTVLI